jgi:peroxiredoxin
MDTHKIRKNTYLFLGFLAFSLVGITFLTVNSKKITAQAAEIQTTSYRIGDIVGDFSLKNVDGNMISLASNEKVGGYILIFTCNHCPYAKAYESRIMALDKKYASLGYPVLAINPNSSADNIEDSFEENVKMATEKGYTFPYLTDDTQLTTKAFEAKRTPTAYILKKENGKFVLKYAGAIDDNAQSASSVTKKYVEQALGEIMLGKNVNLSTTKSIGCGIKLRNT